MLAAVGTQPLAIADGYHVIQFLRQISDRLRRSKQDIRVGRFQKRCLSRSFRREFASGTRFDRCNKRLCFLKEESIVMETMFSARLSPRLQKCSAALVSFALALVFTEATLRATGRFSSEDLHTVTMADYERVPGMWEPNQRFTSIEKPSLPHQVTINSLGLRGPETTLKPKRKRVLCIGDSFTYGDFVDDGETLPAQIQQRLGQDVEVLNGGVKATTIVDQLVFLPRLLTLEPDVVVLTYCENDLMDLYADPPMHEQLRKNRALKSGYLSPVFALTKNTCVFQLLLKNRTRIRRWIAGPTQEAADDPVRDPFAQLPLYATKVGEVRDLLEERNIAFFFVAYPTPNTLAGEPTSTIEPVVEALRNIGIEAINPVPALVDSGKSARQLYLIPEDGHPSPEGHAIVARVVAEHLRRHL